VTLFADEQSRCVIYFAEGNEAATVEAFAANRHAHHRKPTAIDSVSIGMWPAFIRGVSDHFPQAQITFVNFHVIAHAATAISDMRRAEQKLEPSLKGMRWVLLKVRGRLTRTARGYGRFRTVIFLIAGKLDFSRLNPYAALPA
jgi:transposase